MTVRAFDIAPLGGGGSSGSGSSGSGSGNRSSSSRSGTGSGSGSGDGAITFMNPGRLFEEALRDLAEASGEASAPPYDAARWAIREAGRVTQAIMEAGALSHTRTVSVDKGKVADLASVVRCVHVWIDEEGGEGKRGRQREGGDGGRRMLGGRQEGMVGVVWGWMHYVRRRILDMSQGERVGTGR